MPSYEDMAQIDAVQDVVLAILGGAEGAIGRHGDDPDAVAILAAGFAMSIEEIAKRYAPLREIVIEMLQDGSARP